MVSELLSWLSAAPQLAGEALNLDYLPTFAGWSLSVVKSAVKTDILGGVSRSVELKITRRVTVQDNPGRVAVVSALEGLAAWAGENPPAGFRLCTAPLPSFASRSGSGVEDISVNLILEEVSFCPN